MKTPLHYLDGDPTVFRVLNEIGVIAQLSHAALERATPPSISGASFNVLNHLARLPGIWSPAQLASAFQVTRGAMTNTLQRLEAEGFIRIVADAADGRVKRVTVTKAGMRVRDETLRKLMPGMATLAAGLPKSLFAELLPRLAQLRAAMDAARD